MYGLGHLYTTCADCGVSYPAALGDDHECAPDRWLEHQFLRLADEIERFEWEWRSYLASARGRFDVWYAARTRS